jgi:hypothetical protein
LSTQPLGNRKVISIRKLNVGLSAMADFGRAVPRAYSAVAGLSSIGPSSVCNTHNSRCHYQQWAIRCNSRRTELRNADNCRQRHRRIVSCALLHCMRIDTRPIWPFASSNSVQRHFRLWGRSGHCADFAKRSLMTRSGALPPSIDALRKVYSVTSSARASSVAGTPRPSALAVLRLITSSSLVGYCTGSSAGLAPLRMRST